MNAHIIRFIQWLEEQNKKDTRVRAILRRSLSFDPGNYVAAYPYVERFVGDTNYVWRRKAYYLAAGLWAGHWREGRAGKPVPIGKACAHYRDRSGSASIERRFITMLDSDTDQLPYRLRQIVYLLKDECIDFEKMLEGLLCWDYGKKRAQNEWARDFYKTQSDQITADNQTADEKEATK